MFDPDLKNKDIYDALRDSIALNFGDFGYGENSASMSVKYWNPVTGLAIIRSSRDDFRQILAALFFITHVKARKVKISTLYCAGTIRTCERQAVNYIRQWLDSANNLREKTRRELQYKDMLEGLQEAMR
jgi:ribonuclease P/MRP protein subunit POP5